MKGTASLSIESVILIILGVGVFLTIVFYFGGFAKLFPTYLPTNFTPVASAQEGLVRYRVSTGAVEYWGNGWQTLQGDVKIGMVTLHQAQLKEIIEARYFGKPRVYQDLTNGYRLFVVDVFPSQLAYDSYFTDWVKLTWNRGDVLGLVVQGVQQQGTAYILEAKTGKVRFLLGNGQDNPLRLSEGWDARAQQALLEVRRSFLETPFSYAGGFYCGEYYTSTGGLDIALDVKKPVAGGTTCIVKG